MKLSRSQEVASLMYGRMLDNRYIVNKREKGQPRIFKCNCCGKEFDFNNSDDYVGAVKQWEEFGGECYMCAKGFCDCKKKKS